ncbi:ketoacyl-ACP synthase III [Sphingobacteriales bacterium UPWRP_1]|nr:3-oxoacyl-ACP synthase [Sphingobacteriales bacterium TSM_CSM]PSJ74176.1 ketoacyl-ACP synthase III [Sphingobacteriales bacterium UPWRP_1]
MSKTVAAITGVGAYLPDYVLTNAELQKMVDTTDEWIRIRTGISERRILKGEGKATSDMAAKAVEELLKKTNTAKEAVDLLICATVTPDMVFPSTANIICDKTGIRNIPSFDIAAACSGFIYALVTGTQFIQSGLYKKVIVVGADKMSAIADYEDRTTCVLFGDAAAAVMLEPSDNGCGIIDHILRSDGSGRPYLHQKAGGSLKPPSHATIDAREHYVYQDGKTVFKFAVTNMADVSAEIMERNGLKGSDVAWLVPHQANKRIIDATARRMDIDDSKVMLNIHKYGNTTAATIPLCLWEWENQLNKGDNIILAAFGGGFTWGSVYVKWAY